MTSANQTNGTTNNSVWDEAHDMPLADGLFQGITNNQ